MYFPPLLAPQQAPLPRWGPTPAALPPAALLPPPYPRALAPAWTSFPGRSPPVVLPLQPAPVALRSALPPRILRIRAAHPAGSAVKPAASMLDSSAPGELPGGQLTVGPAFVESADLAGLVFDVDGTLLDTMPAFYPSWNIAGEKYGVFLSEEDFYKSAGLPLDVIVRRLFLRCLGHEPDDATVDAFLKLKKETHLELEKAAGAPPAIACVVEIAREAEARGIPVAIATSGSKDDVERHLASNDLTDIFPVGSNRLVFGADVPGRGKPAPDIYLEAARRLGVDPGRCRAFEDGESGLRAAHAAGMHVVDVTAMDRYPAPEGLRRAKADAQAARDWL